MLHATSGITPILISHLFNGYFYFNFCLLPSLIPPPAGWLPPFAITISCGHLPFMDVRFSVIFDILISSRCIYTMIFLALILYFITLTTNYYLEIRILTFLLILCVVLPHISMPLLLMILFRAKLAKLPTKRKHPAYPSCLFLIGIFLSMIYA